MLGASPLKWDYRSPSQVEYGNRAPVTYVQGKRIQAVAHMIEGASPWKQGLVRRGLILKGPSQVELGRVVYGHSQRLTRAATQNTLRTDKARCKEQYGLGS